MAQEQMHRCDASTPDLGATSGCSALSIWCSVRQRLPCGGEAVSEHLTFAMLAGRTVCGGRRMCAMF